MSAEPSLPVFPHDVVWHDGQVARAQRERLLGQRALTVWMTGLSAAGKSTLAFALERELYERGRACYVLDDDNVSMAVETRVNLAQRSGRHRRGRSFCRPSDR